MAIEFALLAPVLIVIAVAIICYSVYFGAAISVQQIAADAARATVRGLNETERAAIARQHVAQAAPSFMLIDPTKLAVQGRSSSVNSDLYEVSVSYDASRLAIWSFAGLLPLPSRVIVRSAAIQRGGY